MLVFRTVGPGPLKNSETSALANYQAAMRFYIWAVAELSQRIDAISQEEFERLRITVDYALDLYQNARWNLHNASPVDSLRLHK